MKTLLFLILTVLSGCSPQTRSLLAIQPNRILYTSQDINRAESIDSIVKLKPGNSWLARNVKIILRNGEQKTIPKKTIWGYSDAKGTIWRRFKNDYYQIFRIGDVIEYEIIEPRTVGPSMVINEPVRKYSKTLDSKIVSSRKRALRSEAN